MLKLGYVLLLVLGIVSCCSLHNVVPRADLEEAPYSVVATFEAGYEERVYPAKAWVCTAYVAAAEEDKEDETFNTLYRYINGTNEAAAAIPMTAPVTVEVVPQAGGLNSYTMCFFIAEDHQASPLQPTEQGVYLENRPEISVYTREFTEYALEAGWQLEADELRQLVAADGNSVVEDDLYRASYQPPFQFWDRRNEVWLIKA
ncbi:heme-binding protein 1 [Hyalella azteca]|uniref:Heme-binding protein 1 n=1 Tax=Hyalella azteca TaxID=294128 RepID=A0A8B7PRF3_HYAAZ|nr:heme-binding protein 1 [Hyalella azteca]